MNSVSTAIAQFSCSEKSVFYSAQIGSSSVFWKVELDDLGRLFQPWSFYDVLLVLTSPHLMKLSVCSAWSSVCLRQQSFCLWGSASTHWNSWIDYSYLVLSHALHSFCPAWVCKLCKPKYLFYPSFYVKTITFLSFRNVSSDLFEEANLKLFFLWDLLSPFCFSLVYVHIVWVFFFKELKDSHKEYHWPTLVKGHLNNYCCGQCRHDCGKIN